MKEIYDIAANYAAGKANEAIDKAIAQAYADGYRDGYKDREEEIPVDLRDNKTEFIDLGLPSGTLWSDDFENIKGQSIYKTYEYAENLSIPTEEQSKELLEMCSWDCDISYGASNTIKKLICVGPNGNMIKFKLTGYITSDAVIHGMSDSLFWIKPKEQVGSMKKAVVLCNRNEKGFRDRIFRKDICDAFMGYKLPIRLVKTKK